MATQYTAGLNVGDVLTAATMNSIGAAWESYTPTLTQGVTVTKTVTYAKYCQIQKLIIVNVRLAVTSAGTAGTEVLVGLPVASVQPAVAVATGYIYDASVNTTYNGTWGQNGTNANAGMYYQSGFFWGTVPNVALANGDSIFFFGAYERS